MHIETLDEYYHYRENATYAFEGHRHTNAMSWEANILLAGSLEITCGERVFRLESGEMAVYNAGVFHRNRVPEARAEFISLHFTSDFPAGEPMVYRLSGTDLSLVSVLDDEAADDGMIAMGHRGRITEAGRDLLEALLLRLEGQADLPPELPIGLSAVYRNAVRLMEERIDENPDVCEIARRCGVCRTTLKNAFAECAGKGVKAYFLELKMERARGLIAGGMAIEAAAERLGFSSPAYFSQCFRRMHGMSATEWRRKSRYGE